MSERILIIQAARFGDLVQSKRLIASVTKDGAEVHLAVDKSLVQLAQLLYPACVTHGFGFHGNQPSLSESEKTLAELRELHFTAVYNCNYSPLTADLCRIFAPEQVHGYRPAHDSTGGILRSGWCRLCFRLSARRYANPLNLTDLWGFFCKTPVAPAAVHLPAQAGGRGLGIAIAGREERRSLSVEALAKAAKTAFGLLNGPKVFLFGSRAEDIRAQKLIRRLPLNMQNQITNLCGKTDWGALHDQMIGLDLLLTPDTGLMHLAAHLGVPVLAFFLSSAWCHETGPYGSGHAILQAAPPCAPCLESAPCQQNNICAHPFADAALGRYIATALHAKNSAGDWPTTLQLWRTGLDEIGANLMLVAGADKFAQTRQENRKFLKNYLNIDPMPVDPAIVRELLPPSEWMLPPWRYC